MWSSTHQNSSYAMRTPYSASCAELAVLSASRCCGVLVGAGPGTTPTQPADNPMSAAARPHTGTRTAVRLI
jgi:hypothetical protein